MENYPIILNNEESSSTVGDYATTIGATVLTVGTLSLSSTLEPDDVLISSNADLPVAHATYYSQASQYQEKTRYQETNSVLEIEEQLEATGALTLKEWLPIDTYLITLPNPVASSDCDCMTVDSLYDVINNHGLKILPIPTHECNNYQTE